MNNRKGFMLAVVLLLASVLVLLAATRHYFSRQQLNAASHRARYEQAFHMAIGSLEISDALFIKAITYINDIKPKLSEKLNKASPEQKPLISLLLDEQGFFKSGDRKAQIDSYLFKKLTSKFPKSSVNVIIKIIDKGPIFKNNTTQTGVVPDNRERQYIIMLQSKSSVDGSTARVVRFRECKYVSILPSILGKFTLFLREHGKLNIDSVKDTKNLVNLNDIPMLVNSGTSAAMHSVLPQKFNSLINKNGWIFLGGLKSWPIGLGEGGGSDELKSSFIENKQFLFNLPSSHKLSSIGQFNYYSIQSSLFSELTNSTNKEALKLIPNKNKLYSSRIRLNGGNISHSPTLVIGNVSRRWALIQGLKNIKTGKYAPLPYLPQSTFNTNIWPGGMSSFSVKKLKENFTNNFIEYSAYMCQIIEEAFNSGNTSIIKFTDSNLKNCISINPANISPDKKRFMTTNLLKIDSVPASLIGMAYGSSYDISNTNNTVLFANADLARFEDISFLKSKAVETFLSSKDFYKSLKSRSKQVKINKIFYVKGDLTIDKPIATQKGCGGMLLVSGNITISSPIIAQSSQPITIVSLNKNIFVKTSATVKAGLIALKGTIKLPNSFDIRGFIAAKDLFIPISNKAARRSVTYNSNFDITNADIYKQSFKLQIPNRSITFVQ